MAADRQRKVKLLAIEEEIARLEVEMLMQMKSSDRYLGVKNDQAQKEDFTVFEHNVLYPVVEKIEKDITSREHKISKIEKANIAGMYTAYNYMQSVRYALDPVPVIGWTVEFQTGVILQVILEYNGDALRVCVLERSKLKKMTHDLFKWTPLWTAIPTAFTGLQADLFKVINNAIGAVVHVDEAVARPVIASVPLTRSAKSPDSRRRVPGPGTAVVSNNTPSAAAIVPASIPTPGSTVSRMAELAKSVAAGRRSGRT